MSVPATLRTPGEPLPKPSPTALRCPVVGVLVIAVSLGCLLGYLSQLLKGKKPLSAVGDDFLRRSADFLDMQVVLVYLLAGRLKAADFFQSPAALGSDIAKALTEICRSNIAAETAVDMATLSELPERVKLMLVLLYERSEGVVLLPARLSHNEVAAFGQPQVPFEIRLNKPT